MNDNGSERDILLRLITQSAANAVYRCITEMHSFFCCDTVHNEVSTQFSRDLKGTLASLFNEKTTLGKFKYDRLSHICLIDPWHEKMTLKVILNSDKMMTKKTFTSTLVLKLKKLGIIANTGQYS